MKLNVFDNNILITGWVLSYMTFWKHFYKKKSANLSENYFIDRQDRYYLIKNCPELANYLEELINVISSNSYLVAENGELVMANDQPQPTKTKEYLKVFKQHFKLFTFSYKQNSKRLV